MNKTVDNASLTTNNLESEVANLIVSTLNLEMAAHDIDPDSPLYSNGLGIDSIDILELALAISKQYGCQMSSDDPDNKTIFSSLRHLTVYIATNRTK